MCACGGRCARVGADASLGSGGCVNAFLPTNVGSHGEGCASIIALLLQTQTAADQQWSEALPTRATPRKESLPFSHGSMQGQYSQSELAVAVNAARRSSPKLQTACFQLRPHPANKKCIHASTHPAQSSTSASTPPANLFTAQGHRTSVRACVRDGANVYLLKAVALTGIPSKSCTSSKTKCETCGTHHVHVPAFMCRNGERIRDDHSADDERLCGQCRARK